MRILLAFLLVISISAVGYLEFSSISDMDDLSLVGAVNEHLLEVNREQSAASFNQSLENESFGNILNRAADLLTTRVAIISMRKSEAIWARQSNRNVIVDVSYALEKTSSDTQQLQNYLLFTSVGPNQWVYRHNSSKTDFYLNYLGFN